MASSCTSVWWICRSIVAMRLSDVFTIISVCSFIDAAESTGLNPAPVFHRRINRSAWITIKTAYQISADSAFPRSNVTLFSQLVESNC